MRMLVSVEFADGVRRRRRPILAAGSVVCTCTPIAHNKRASWHHPRRTKRCLARRLLLGTTAPRYVLSHRLQMKMNKVFRLWLIA